MRHMQLGSFLERDLMAAADALIAAEDEIAGLPKWCAICERRWKKPISIAGRTNVGHEGGGIYRRPF
jgi:hypothetical protein